jgi:hypothetical protein
VSRLVSQMVSRPVSRLVSGLVSRPVSRLLPRLVSRLVSEIKRNRLVYSMLRNNASGPEIGLPGQILAGLLPGIHRHGPSGRPPGVLGIRAHGPHINVYVC